MNIKEFNILLDDYKKNFNQYYYSENDISSQIILKDMLMNKINNYIDFLNISLIKNFLDNHYSTKKLRILDLGCGALDKTFILKKLYPNAELFGVESIISDDPEHVEINKTRFDKPRFFQALKKDYDINFILFDGRNLHFPEEYFDIILLYATIEHIRPWDRNNFITKTQSKLKKDGFFIIARCPQKYGLFEMISEKISHGAHRWRMTINDFKNIFPENKYKIVFRKNLNNIFTKPSFIVNSLYILLIAVDKILNYIKWPLFSDYFIIIKKNE